jgi:hypothetical protein
MNPIDPRKSNAGLSPISIPSDDNASPDAFRANHHTILNGKPSMTKPMLHAKAHSPRRVGLASRSQLNIMYAMIVRHARSQQSRNELTT